MAFFKLLSILALTTSTLFASYVDKKIIDPKIIKKKSYQQDNRNIQDITLKGNGDINFKISFPKKLTTNLNVLILVDGLETGKNSLDYFKHPDDYILVGYEFEKKVKLLTKKTSYLHSLSLRKAALAVPYQLLSIVKWIEKRKFTNKKIDFLGLSFGSVFVPATYHIAAVNNIALGKCILAFGGAGLYDIFLVNLKVSKAFKKPASFLAYSLLRPIDPKFHLPYMKGEFLIINGTQDSRIPIKSRALLEKLTPKPKKIINSDTFHMDPDNIELIEEVYDISLKWLNS